MAIESIMQRFGRGPLSLLLDVVSDISTRKQLEKLRKEYIAMVSHELRSPLTSIAGWLTIMNEEFHTELPPRVVQIIHKVQRQSQHMLDLVDVILDIERLEAGQWPLDIEPVAISDVVAAAIETLQMVAAEVKVHIEFEPTDALAAADRARLLQVMINLLGNAIKFSPEGATITVSARQLAGLVEVIVADHGRGVPLAMREAIFEPFRQVKLEDATRQRGTGLGLAICKQIVHRLGGTIGVYSTEGNGST